MQLTMNRELVRLARGDRSQSLIYLILGLCAAAMVTNLLRETFHLRARAPVVAAALTTRADRLAMQFQSPAPNTNLTVVPATPGPSKNRS